MLTSRRRCRGVTLIELMIGVSLVAIVLALAMPSFSVGAQNRQIRSAADAIQNGLTVAKTEALRRNRSVTFELQPNAAWRVGCTTTDTTVVDGEQVCPETLQTRSATEGSTQTTVTPRQIVGTATGTEASTQVFTGNIAFTPLGRVAPATLPAGNVAVFRVTHATGGNCVSAATPGPMRCLTVVVTAAGQVRMCDPATTAGDPRAC